MTFIVTFLLTVIVGTYATTRPEREMIRLLIVITCLVAIVTGLVVIARGGL